MTKTLKSLFFTLTIFSFLLLTGCLDNNTSCNLTANLDADEAQLAADIDSIDAYLERNNIDAQVHSSGIRYVILQEGEGPKPTVCDVVTVTYEGSFLSNGEVFDSSDSPVLLAIRNLIPGWQVGIPLVRPGGRIRLYIPSGYAYGPTGAGDVIPPDANLVFEIKLF